MELPEVTTLPAVTKDDVTVELGELESPQDDEEVNQPHHQQQQEQQQQDEEAAARERRKEMRRLRKARAVAVGKKVAAFLFSHIGLAGMVVAYSVLGGFLFEALEAPNEMRQNLILSNLKEEKIEAIHQLAVHLQLKNVDGDEFKRKVRFIMIQFQKNVTTAVRDLGWDGEDMTEQSTLKWNFASSLLFAVTVITSIGYGHVAPKTQEGRLVTIFYAILGIPLTFLYLSNIGNFLADCFRWFYKRVICDIFCLQRCERQKRRAKQRAKRQKAVEQRMRALISGDRKASRAALDYGTDCARVALPGHRDDIPDRRPSHVIADGGDINYADNGKATLPHSRSLSAIGHVTASTLSNGGRRPSSLRSTLTLNDVSSGVSQGSSNMCGPVRETDIVSVTMDPDGLSRVTTLNLGSTSGDEGSVCTKLARCKETDILSDITSNRAANASAALSDHKDDVTSTGSSRLKGESAIRPRSASRAHVVPVKGRTARAKSLASIMTTNDAVPSDSSKRKVKATVHPVRRLPKSVSDYGTVETGDTVLHQQGDGKEEEGDEAVGNTDSVAGARRGRSFSTHSLTKKRHFKRRSLRHKTHLEVSEATRRRDSASISFQNEAFEGETEPSTTNQKKKLPSSSPEVVYRDRSPGRGTKVMGNGRVGVRGQQASYLLQPLVQLDADEASETDEKVTVPITVCLILMTGYISLGAVLFSVWEDWDFLTGCYFCFVTLSTIGFGDIVPGMQSDAWLSHEKLILCALWLAFGLSLLAMCFNLMQEEVREKCRWIGYKLGLLKDIDDEDEA